jgi:hypothetical protein
MMNDTLLEQPLTLEKESELFFHTTRDFRLKFRTAKATPFLPKMDANFLT